VFSGLVKINDPKGTAIKLEEYFDVFAQDFAGFFKVFIPYSLELAVFLNVLEVVLGVALLVRFMPVLTMYILLPMILFFTFLTGYSAILNKVTDCGCFGDAIPLVPWESFIKDIILTLLIGVLFLKRKALVASGGLAIRGGIVALSTIAGLVLAIQAINHLPFMDFRSYAVGNNIPTLMQDRAPLRYDYIYEKEGKEYVFDMTSLPTDTTYKFKDSRLQNPEDQRKITDFAIWNDEGTFTEEALTGTKLLVVLQNIEHAANAEKLKQVSQLMQQATGVAQVWLVTSASGQDLEDFRHQHQLVGNVYYGDATVLKAVIRSNPGTVLLKNGTVLGKWHYNDTPTLETLKELL